MSVIVNGEPRHAPGSIVHLAACPEIEARVLSVQVYDRWQTTYTVSWLSNGDRKVETVSEFELAQESKG